MVPESRVSTSARPAVSSRTGPMPARIVGSGGDRLPDAGSHCPHQLSLVLSLDEPRSSGCRRSPTSKITAVRRLEAS